MDDSTAIIFPGQGCQRPGMGRDFHDMFEAARRVYEEASDALGLDLRALCFEPDERLGLTEYAQPAILTTEIAMLRAIEAEFGLAPRYWGGHSLGEYAALVGSRALPLWDAVRVVRQRGRLMQEAVPVGAGKMLAVIACGLDRRNVERAICGLEVAVANDNCADQIVLSGRADAADQARRNLAEALAGGEVRFVELEVSAPFHSPLMRSIEPAFAQVLAQIRSRIDAWQATRVLSNASGGFHDGGTESVLARLLSQISATVRWRANMETLLARCRKIVEIGPGRPLRGFFKSLGVEVETVTSVRSAQKLFSRGPSVEISA